ncbi:MAG: hypothetical protein E7638_01120 [Ruminococcaceae bacterium]|nr:hypothetical protein [Oscillospiraceae bacterium]
MKLRFLSLALTLMLIFACTIPAIANAAEPPCFTVLVNNAPDDLQISLIPSYELCTSFVGDGIPLLKSERGWESYFRCTYNDNGHPLDKEDIANALLIAKSDSEDISLTLSLPSDLPQRYNNIFTLNLDNGTLTDSYSPRRDILLIGMRVGITLVVETAILFFAFGYREKRTWLVFLIANLATQTLLNLVLTGDIPPLGYWQFAYYGGELLIFITEAFVFARYFREHTKKRAVLGAVVANTVSLITGALLLTNLPV